jgi:hypothetical protein
MPHMTYYKPWVVEIERFWHLVCGNSTSFKFFSFFFPNILVLFSNQQWCVYKKNWGFWWIILIPSKILHLFYIYSNLMWWFPTPTAFFFWIKIFLVANSKIFGEILPIFFFQLIF